MGTVWSWPNQQVVRADQSGPGVNTPPPGMAMAADQPETDVNAAPSAADLDAMTKDELLAHAQGLGITPANAGMTKEEIRAGIDDYYATP